jgi:hypothetical protein
MSTTYAEHTAQQQQQQQQQQQNHPSPNNNKNKRSVGRKITLTDRPALSDSNPQSEAFSSPYTSLQIHVDEKNVDLTSVPEPRFGQRPKTTKMQIPEWEDIPVWRNWPFECIEGHKAHAKAGLRSFVYVAHGQDFSFVPKVKEDIWGDRYNFFSFIFDGLILPGLLRVGS